MYIARQNGLLADYDDEQLEILRENIANVQKAAEMRAKGRDRWGPEEYKFAFAIKSGLIRLPDKDKPLWDPDAHMLGLTPNQAVSRGLFNVKRWLGDQKSAEYLQINNDPFPDLPKLDAWGGTSLPAIADFGAGSKSQGSRWDLRPRSLAPTQADVLSGP